MNRSIEIVVRESGSHWPDWLNHSVQDDRILVSVDDAAPDGEQDISLRVRHLLARLARDGRHVRRAVVLVGSAAENPLFDSRRMLSRALVASLDPSGSELIFVAGSAPETQQKLLSLVGALSDLLAGTHVDVSLRFAAPAGTDAPSGVRSTAPPRRRLRAVE